jgi:hypothetical protein
MTVTLTLEIDKDKLDDAIYIVGNSDILGVRIVDLLRTGNLTRGLDFYGIEVKKMEREDG